MLQDTVRMLFVKKQALAQDSLETLKKLAQGIEEETIYQMSSLLAFPSHDHYIKGLYQNDECNGY